MDFGTLVSQFRSWVQEHLLPWVKANLSRAERIAISSDHGFVALLPEDAVDVATGSGEERNLPRVFFGTLTGDQLPVLVLDRDGQTITLAASRRWFRKSGGRAWQFAHGGCTLVETLVPFAELVPLAAGQADVRFEGLPSKVDIQEGETFDISFQVTVTGGRERTPTVEVVGHGSPVPLELGQAVRVRVPVTAAEGLATLIVRVRSDGRVVAERVVPVTVKLAKLKRTQLDLDL